ncbi:MAG: 16S rRNA (guanine(527)-N(7))-methyltransferase RsmG [Flavobacteriaceae bacterium]|nr:16S rRNA (guanine(527)-N(7))-methyltransferase RsmG [Flavobacteriaceae bacterium]
MEILLRYFNNLSEIQKEQFSKLENLYKLWNAQINVISRKDIDDLYLRHVLHALGITKVQEFKPGSKILDIGTGGGFPGIPLAIMFPESDFYLVDSIGKKIKVVQAVADELELNNIKAEHIRAEKVNGEFDFIVSRAVTNMDDFVKWTKKKIAKKQNHELKNGILYLKGGDLSEELQNFPKATIYNLTDYFKEDFFETKKLVHIPLKYKP